MYSFKQIYTFIITMIGTLFFSGYFPKFPGTVASLFSLIIIIPLKLYLSLNSFIDLTLIILIFCLIIAFIYEKILTIHDDKKFVLDEFIGQMIVFIFFTHLNLVNIILAFSLFRIFDITKPLIIGMVDRQKSFISTVLDDVLAGILAGVILYYANYFIITFTS